jgi:hypothetical protein
LTSLWAGIDVGGRRKGFDAAVVDAERIVALARAVCGIRYTPSRATLDEGDPYYEWIRHGLELYERLDGAAWRVVECFPTASWTRWCGPRDGRSRAAWSTGALASLGLAGLPKRTSQDARDAIAAALTARCLDQGATVSFGEIVVPA